MQHTITFGHVASWLLRAVFCLALFHLNILIVSAQSPLGKNTLTDHLQVEMEYTEPDTFVRLKTYLPLRDELVDDFFAVKDSLVYFEGDIILGHLRDLENPVNAGRGVGLNIFKWADATIPYVIGAGFSSQMIDRINEAIQIVSDSTNLCIIPRTAEADYVTFTYQTGGCSSAIGNISLNQFQRINLSEGCGVYNIVHEIFHTAGVFHEQSRIDRDDYVQIITENIIPERRGNFSKVDPQYADDIGPYDFSSLMHYPAVSFSINGQPTIVTINPPNAPIGQRDSLSTGDIETINTMYPLRCDALCQITGIITGTQFPCDNNAYDQELIITFDSAPFGSELIVNGQVFPVSTSPQSIVLQDLPADGNPVDVNAYFSLAPDCQLSITGLYTAPQTCPEICTVTNITAGPQSACDPATNAYTQAVTVWYANPPQSGTLVINGQQFPITQSPQTETIQLLANGVAVDVTAFFSADPACTLTKNDFFIAPEACNLIGCLLDASYGDIQMDAGIYQIAQDIESAATVESGYQVEYVAGNSVTLLAGFQAEPGANFIARIDSCSTSPCGADNILLSRTYGGSLTDEVSWSGFTTTSDGGFAFAGPSYSSDFDVSANAGQADFWLVKLDGNGDLDWEQNFGTANEEWCQAIAQTSDNGFVLAGYRCSGTTADCFDDADKDFLIIKTDATGSLDWERVYGDDTGIDAAFDVIQTSDGGYMVVGYSDTDANTVFSENQGKYDIWALKLDSSGDIDWKANFGGAENDTPFQVIEATSGGGYLIVGDTRSGDGDVGQHFGENDFWLLRLSSTGTLLWEKTYGGNGIDRGRAIYPTMDGGYMLAGESGSNDFDLPGTVTSNFGSSDVHLVKVDDVGELEWSKSYGGSNWDVAFSVLQDADGHFVFVGNTDSEDFDVSCNNLAGTADAWLVKVDANTHEIIREETYGGSSGDYLQTLQALPNGELAMIGHSNSNDGDVGANYGERDAWLLLVDDFLPASSLADPTLPQTPENRTTDLQLQNIDLRIFPNPVRGDAQIEFALPAVAQVQLDLITVSGGLVRSLIPERTETAGRHQFHLTDRDLPNGLYLLRLRVNGEWSTRKMVVHRY